MKKNIIISLVILGIIVGGYFGYKNTQSDMQRNLMSVLPENAVYILKTNELTDTWKEVSKTNIWQHFIKTKGFEYLQSVDTLLNNTLLDNKASKVIFNNRPTAMAAYVTSATDYDFVYVVDLQQSEYIKKILNRILKLSGSHKVVNLSYNQTKIYKLINKKDKENTVYITSLDNLLIVSFSYKLIKHVLDEKSIEHWIKRTDFQQINDELGNGLVQLYLNYKQLPQYLRIYFSNLSQETQKLTQDLDLTGLDISHEDERISMEGITLIDSTQSYLNAMLDIKPGKIGSYDVISNETAMLTAISFKDFDLFYQSLLNSYTGKNKSKKTNYRNNLKKLEKFFKIDLQNDLFDWIGQEIDLVKIRSNSAQRPADLLLLIQAGDMDDARDGLIHITEQIRKRSPFKFKSYNYKNFTINYLHQKTFFKTILGNMFAKIEKPYYTFIENYVVFSNSEQVLKNFIDDYVTGNTLSHNKDFMDFKDEFNNKSNVMVYLQMPKLYHIMQQSLTATGRKTLDEKKDLMLSFSRIGLQLSGKDEYFKTLLVIDHDEKALQKEQAEQLAKKIDKNVHNTFFEDLQFKISFPDSLQVADGKYKQFYDDGTTLKVEGQMKNNLPYGIWRTYYTSGNLQNVTNYDEGDVTGEFYQYFDKKPRQLMVQANYDHDLLEGEYFEYWQNGAIKAKLHYKDGKLHGEALYYFPTGQLKTKGKYRKGEKKGKWLFYNPKGEVIGKKRYSGFLF